MTVVKPEKNRHTILETNTGLKITIPGKIDWLSIPFLSLAAFFGAFVDVGFILIVIDLITDPRAADFRVYFTESGLQMSPVYVFMIIWFGGVTILSFLAFYNLIWQLRGREIIEIQKEKISIQNRVIKWERKKVFLANEIKDLRSSRPPTRFNFRKLIILFGNSDGHIAFDYGAKTYRFGRDIEEAEAKRILETITTRFPQYKSP